MKWNKIVRVFLISVLSFLTALIIFLAFSIGPIDRTPAKENKAFSEMQEVLKTLDTVSIQQAETNFFVGFATVNLTPSTKTSTAGYGNRRGKTSTGIRDSIFVRAIVVSNGKKQIAIVTADLLLIPPRVTEMLKTKLDGIGFSLNNTFLGATHTHNSIGNWSTGITEILYGDYEEEIVEFISNKIIRCIELATKNVRKSVLKSGAIPIRHVVKNRLIEGGPEDSLLRVVEIHREDSSKLLLMSFTAHATCLYSRDLEISRDYPGKLVDIIESRGYNFAMFMAGAVGSHTPTPPLFGPECIDWMAEEIAKTFLANRDQLSPINDSTIAMVRVPLKLNDPQVKITNSLSVRSWLFRASVGEYPVYLSALRLGTVILLGTPCDFSGEFNPSLDAFSSQKGFQNIVTSFNGGYIGYLTPVSRYDVDHFETQFMNWYAPGTGETVEGYMEYMINVLGSNK